MIEEEWNRLLLQSNQNYADNKFEEAALGYEALIPVAPDNPVLWHNYSLALINLGRLEDAIRALDIPTSAGYAESHLSKGSALRSLGRYEEAIAEFSTCFILDPDNAKAYSNYGNSLREFGLPDAAIPFFNKALSKVPDDPTFRLNESVAQLLKGDLIAGWKNYDARWFYQSDVSFKPVLPGVEYNGTQSLSGKIICVYSEQGFGDSIQFVRYLKILQQMGAKVVLVTRPQLVELFQYNFPDVDIRTDYNNLAYHYHVPLMDLPKCFNTTIDTVPYPDPYLSVSGNLTKKYEQLLGSKTKKRVGIVWSSNSIAFITRFRQVPLEKFLISLTDTGCEIVNIEFDISLEERDLLNKYSVKIVEQEGFDDTAALIKTMDLVVTVDTVYAHLAGALGVPTYVMLSDYGMDWRWFLKRTDSPFYKCVKLFRQHGDADWLPVFQDIKNEIKSTT